MNPFHKTYGTDYLKEPLPIAILLSLTIACAHLIATKGLIVGLAIIILLIAIVYLGVLFAKPRIGIMTIFVLNFTILGLGRYVPMTWGLLIDVLLFLMYLALFFKAFKLKIPWSRAKSQLSLLVNYLVWLCFVSSCQSGSCKFCSLVLRYARLSPLPMDDCSFTIYHF